MQKIAPKPDGRKKGKKENGKITLVRGNDLWHNKNTANLSGAEVRA